MAEPVTTPAVVLRTIAFQDHHLIVHLYTEDYGKVHAMARFVTGKSSRFKARLEPFTTIGATIAPGRGGLHRLSEASLLQDAGDIRFSWHKQELGSILFAFLSSTLPEQDPQPDLFLLIDGYLRRMADPNLEKAQMPGVLVATILKVLQLTGHTPAMDACVRCTRTDRPITAFSNADGGVVCSQCQQNADSPMQPWMHELIIQLMNQPIDQITAGQPGADGHEQIRAMYRQWLSPFIQYQTGHRLKPLAKPQRISGPLNA